MRKRRNRKRAVGHNSQDEIFNRGTRYIFLIMLAKDIPVQSPRQFSGSAAQAVTVRYPVLKLFMTSFGHLALLLFPTQYQTITAVYQRALNCRLLFTQSSFTGASTSALVWVAMHCLGHDDVPFFFFAFPFVLRQPRRFRFLSLTLCHSCHSRRLGLTLSLLQPCDSYLLPQPCAPHMRLICRTASTLARTSPLLMPGCPPSAVPNPLSGCRI